MRSLLDARSTISQQIHPLPSEPISLWKAAGRVLHTPTLAPHDLPAFDRSAMDGYAIRKDDPSDRFRVLGTVEAGSELHLSVGVGECARIFTGAAIPEGASQVILQENCTLAQDWMTPTKRDSNTWIRTCGEDAKKGDILIPSHTRLTPGALSLLAFIGQMEVAVSPRPRVIHFVTGSELVDPNSPPAPGQIRDSNSILIRSLLDASGGELIHQQRVQDSLSEIIHYANSISIDQWDVLLISGGASVGDFDFGARVLGALGFTIHFDRLNLRPGKPLIFASRGKQVAFVIPGNPVSHFVTYHLAIAHALKLLAGLPSQLELPKLRLNRALPVKSDPRETWCPSEIAVENGELFVSPLAWQSSGDLRGLVGANALARIPANAPVPAVGDLVECLVLELPQ